MESQTSAIETPLAERHRRSGAHLGSWFGCVLPDDFGDWRTEYRFARQSVALPESDTPLGAMLWPAEWKSDGAGKVYIPVLTAGRHALRVKGTAASAEVWISVLPWACRVAAAVKMIDSAMMLEKAMPT